MSDPSLPQEIIDHITDLLQDDPETLRRCCLVSKPWIPRTRKYLFADINLKRKDFSKWRKLFPNPSDSPAYHTRALKIGSVLGDVGECSWICQSFSHVERLILEWSWASLNTGVTLTLAPFHTLASSLRSLQIISVLLPHTQVFDLICSLPLLEDVRLSGDNIVADGNQSPRGSPTIGLSSTLPALTGVLELSMFLGMERTLRRFLDLPGGLRFRRLELAWCGAVDFPRVAELVVSCSNTVEYIDITCNFSSDGHTPGQVDLSKATKLKEVVLRCASLDCGWAVAALETITSEHRDFRQISVKIPYHASYLRNRSVKERLEAANPGWSDFDRLLIQFWDLRSIHSRLGCSRTTREVMEWAEYLLPAMTKRATVGLIE